jgi:glycosyltransferase involved in cell wall biosynthesis
MQAIGLDLSVEYTAPAPTGSSTAGKRLLRIDVIVPAYNAAATIIRSVESILRQKHVKQRVIIVDHGSIDQTPELCRSLAHDDRVSYMRLTRRRRERRGAARPLNAGFHKSLSGGSAGAAWIMRLDADDVLHSDDCLYRALTSIEADAPEVQLICGGLIFLSIVDLAACRFVPKDGLRQVEQLRSASAYSIPHHSLIINVGLLTNVYRRRGYWYNCALSYGEDLEFTLYMLSYLHDRELVFVDVDIVVKVLHERSLSSTLGSIRIVADHLKIFLLYPSLDRKLLLRAIIDCAFRSLHLTKCTWLRRALGLPGEVYGNCVALDVDGVLQRIREMEQPAILAERM